MGSSYQCRSVRTQCENQRHWAAPLSYANISSATSDTLTLSPSVVDPGDNILCRVTATDADGGSAQGTDVVTVDNSDPVVTDVQIRPDTNVTTSTTLTCTATATDPDGGTPSLSYQWAKQTGGTGTPANISSATSDTLTLSPSVVDPGDNILCRVTATDADGGSPKARTDNSDPVVTDVQIKSDTNVVTDLCDRQIPSATPSLSYQ